MRRMFRYEVPVDDREHRHVVHGEVRKVATQAWTPGRMPVVEFWAENADPAPDGTLLQRTFQVFGTGHPLPENAQWRGTTDRDQAGLVWHLYELTGEGDG
jgi:hypothetical protein